MIPDPVPTTAAPAAATILYACIAHGPTVLADFLPLDDAGLAGVAERYLSLAPPLHRHYSHAAQGRIYAFLFSEPLVFFAIAPNSLVSSSSHLLLLLGRLRDAVLRSPSSSAIKQARKPLSLQEELLPHLRYLATQLPSLPSQDAIPGAPPTGHYPKPERDVEEKHKRAKKDRRKKKNPPSESRMAICDDHHDGNVGRGIGIMGVKQAERMWRRQVRVVLLVDLVVCSLLFGIWLSVCRGFQCIAG